MKKINEQDPVGHTIAGYEVLGQERDGTDHWVGADLLLRVPLIGAFFLNVVTKEHFLDESLEDVLGDIADPEILLTQGATSETKPPFVLNDQEITDDVLKTKFMNRVIGADLARSLWDEGTQ